MMDKKSLRKNLLQTRTQMNPIDWQQRSQQLTERLLAQACLEAGQTVLSYFSIRQEPDLTRLWEPESLALRFGFPRCADDSRSGRLCQRLIWHRWKPGESLIAGSFGILEPSRGAPELQAVEVDWMLVPCVGCDRNGYRIGYGGGFYDRLLANPEWRKVKTIGITFDIGLVENFVPEAWDQPLDYVCTEKRWIAFNR